MKMCYVTATELKNNLSFYLEKAMEEDVYVTKNNKVICIMSNPRLAAFYRLDNLVKEAGINDDSKKSIKDLIGEAIEEKCGY